MREETRSRGSSVGYGLDDRGFESRQGLRIFLFTAVSRPALGPTQPPIQWVSRALSKGVKRPVHEADHSPPSSAKVKNAWSYISTPPIRLCGAQLRHRDNFTIYLYERRNMFLTLSVVKLYEKETGALAKKNVRTCDKGNTCIAITCKN
jgi:hypothetical protein